MKINDFEIESGIESDSSADPNTNDTNANTNSLKDNAISTEEDPYSTSNEITTLASNQEFKNNYTDNKSLNSKAIVLNNTTDSFNNG